MDNFPEYFQPITKIKVRRNVIIDERIFLSVKKEDDDTLRRLGATFEPSTKRWYVSKSTENRKELLRLFSQQIRFGN